jgi:ribosomal protein S27E
MARDIFISYTQRDRSVAEELCRGLESSGLACWIAPRNIEAGMDWTNGIIGAIESCKCMVLVFSGGTSESEHVRRELLHAVESKLRVFPFRIEDAVPKGGVAYCLKGMQWFDATTSPMDANIALLSEQLHALLENEPAGPMPSDDIHFECPKCKHPLVVGASGAGCQVPCPVCNETLVIPSSSIPAKASTPPSAPTVTFDPAAIKRIALALAESIGPIAATLVNQAAAKCRSHSELIETLAAELETPDDRERFLRTATSALRPR